MYKVLIVASTILLAACGGTPAYRTSEVPVPSTYTLGAATTARVDSRAASTTDEGSLSAVRVSAARSTPFWAELGDTTLAKLVREAQRANMDVRIAESRLTGARAAKHLAALDLVPTVTGAGYTTRTQFSTAVTPGLPRLPTQTLWDVGFDASWELDIFGRVGRNVKGVGALAEASQHGLEDVQVSVAAEVARTYFDLRGAQRQLAVSQQFAATPRKIVRLTEDRLAAGRGTAFDTERAKSVLYLALAATPRLESQIAVDRNRLAVLLGRAPDALPAAVLDSGSLPRLPDTLYVGSPEQLVRQRPDVLRAERELAASALFVGGARAEYLPKVTLSARGGYMATSVDSLFKSSNSRLLFGPVLTIPLFDVGRVRQRVEVAEAGQNEAQATYNATVLQALEESEASLVTYDRAHASLAILEDAVKSSAKAADLAQQRFEAGLTDLLQVLDAERTLLDSQNQLVQGHTAAAT
ncbi:MAG TPA: efflux transporter outer membrane subunit, partial [Gemmatimonadaceae bacterium]|nr:efflux transporter outer membrane subunit [Gemmatimonadaceae bacterium]